MSIAYDLIVKEIELKSMDNVLTTLSNKKKIAAKILRDPIGSFFIPPW